MHTGKHMLGSRCIRGAALAVLLLLLTNSARAQASPAQRHHGDRDIRLGLLETQLFTLGGFSQEVHKLCNIDIHGASVSFPCAEYCARQRRRRWRTLHTRSQRE